MIRGLYTSGYGMLTLQKKMDVVSNNLANVSTNGFKKDGVVFESFADVLTSRMHDSADAPSYSAPLGTMSLFSNLGEVYTDYTQGTFEQTGNATDLAINGDDGAFFTVARPNDTAATDTGTTAAAGGTGAADANANADTTAYLTRDGGFFVNAQGLLVNRDGYPVLGENGQIALQGSEFEVLADGTVMQDGATVDRLKIAHIDNPETLRKFGENLLTVSDETTQGTFTGGVLQGSVEMSNVESVREMVEMITVMRAYEANAKVLQTADTTLDKAVNDVGRT